MTLVLLVRHGQATTDAFAQGGYDQLSPLGFEQSKLLGRYLVTSGVRPDAVFVGPRRRHRETHDTVAAVIREAGLSWPPERALEELDEFQAEPFVAHADPRDPSPPGFLGRYREVVRRWVRGELSPPDVEPWHRFRARVGAGLERMFEELGRGKTAVAFTSAGTVAAATAHVLGLTDERTLDLVWAMRNAAVTELRGSAQRRWLQSFNGVPHLSRAELVTLF
jgi:broad specificity phosphatase PhoE